MFICFCLIPTPNQNVLWRRQRVDKTGCSGSGPVCIRKSGREGAQDWRLLLPPGAQAPKVTFRPTLWSLYWECFSHQFSLTPFCSPASALLFHFSSHSSQSEPPKTDLIMSLPGLRSLTAPHCASNLDSSARPARLEAACLQPHLAPSPGCLLSSSFETGPSVLSPRTFAPCCFHCLQFPLFPSLSSFPCLFPLTLFRSPDLSSGSSAEESTLTL